MADLRSLIVVLGDPLDRDAAAFDGFDAHIDAVWMAEVAEESTHVESSKPRIVMFLAAMRHFRKSLRMEYFYREQRQRHKVLMQDDEPVGGPWNFDADNREAFGAAGPGAVPPRAAFAPDAITREVNALVNTRFAQHPGALDSFAWPVTRLHALQSMQAFVQQRLPLFGRYIATGKCIQRMSPHCQACRYDPAQRSGDSACPFTTLDWDFLMRHESALAKNPRMALQVKNVARLSEQQKQAVKERAAAIRRGEVGVAAGIAPHA